ncbi:MAG: MFS transporter [Hyphomicrobiales bacterium]|nr:MFS transporter [Hyphomicrobiales bacterium]
MNPLYLLLLGIGFSSSLALRSLDPLTVSIAGDLSVAPETAALLGTALSIPYALTNPILGPMGDHFGKGRMITICLWFITASVFVSSLAPTFAVLIVLRAVTGMAAGGIVPLGQAMIGDMFQAGERQIAIARSTAVIFLGQLAGASLAGVADEWIGWRGVLIACGCIAGVAAMMATWKMPRARPQRTDRFSAATIIRGYLIILRIPRSWACYANCYIQAGIMFGLLPFVSLILERLQLGAAREAGFIIAGFSTGSLLFVLSIRLTVRLLSRSGLLIVGAVIGAIGLLAASTGPQWYWLMIIFACSGYGYFLQHNAIQGAVADLSEDYRGSAYSMHASMFFLGAATAPILYSLAFSSFGVRATLTAAAVIFIVVGIASSAVFAWFQRRGL